METKGGKKKSSSSSSKSSLFYEAPLGYSIEDVRPNGGIKKFRSAAYSNVRFHNTIESLVLLNYLIFADIFFLMILLQCARKPS
ncbi:hypothetical protein TanjilG_23934 [Lupinus angustifolius]|uniref:Uncharacterized protein n=1 Tax=Lupinus angustifolius TaxID=3871 RepID=A0A1J7H6Y3_LUPAN|nr:hypothetical protein TanjilG_23934 [Lupinus angustifolius]